MARIKTEGLDELMLSMKECADLPDDVADEMLQTSGKIVAESQRKKITASILDRPSSGVLAKSVKVSRMKTRKNGERYVTVYPQGTHHVNADGTKVSNNEVYFVNEYGAPKKHIAAKGIAKAANAESADEATAAQTNVYDKWLRSKNL